MKAKDQIKMAVAKAALDYPLKRQGIKVEQKALVVGGGVSGISAALTLANLGYECYLIEKQDELGGNGWKLDTTYQGEKIGPWLRARCTG